MILIREAPKCIKADPGAMHNNCPFPYTVQDALTPIHSCLGTPVPPPPKAPCKNAGGRQGRGPWCLEGCAAARAGSALQAGLRNANHCTTLLRATLPAGEQCLRDDE